MTARVHLPSDRRLRLGVAVLAVLLISPAVGHVPRAAAQSQGQQTRTFDCVGYNPGHENFTVPAKVTQLHVLAQGGQGAGRSGALAGGYGGIVKATVPVTPGEVLNIFAGCAGHHWEGWGWGAGGTPGRGHSYDAENGGYGGGGSAVIRPDLTQLVVAGGGGGGGGDGAGGGLAGQGGGGGNGGIKPQPGQNGCADFGCPTAGGPPAGGKGGCAVCMGAGNLNGGSGTSSSAVAGGGGGGGGGGGYIGGGGGHAGPGFVAGDGGGGGGGGSSYVIDSATNVSYGTGTGGGDGSVVLSWWSS